MKERYQLDTEAVSAFYQKCSKEIASLEKNPLDPESLTRICSITEEFDSEDKLSAEACKQPQAAATELGGVL